MAGYRGPAAVMTERATAFLAALSDSQRAVATFPFDTTERFRWAFIPNEMFPRTGLTLKAMSESQRELAHALLKTGLSQRGYLTTTTIIELENVLQILEGPTRRFPRDPEMYWLSVFGTPSARGAWGWRFEGHHLSLHFTIVNGDITVSTPTFLGANPANVPSGPRRGMRPMREQEDTARDLLAALDEAQRKVAIFDQVAPTNVVTGAELVVNPLEPVGIKGAALSAKQREMLMAVIDSYISIMADDIAELRRAAVRRGGLENTYFAWAGSTERGQVAYYRVQGPEFLIEFDNTQKDPNHIHAAFRDFDGDLGRDLLREHVKQAH